MEIIVNSPPSAPTRPSGPTSLRRWVSGTYSTSAVDPDNDAVYYQWYWGDGDVTCDSVPHVSGETVTREHRWSALGRYNVTVCVNDMWGNSGGCSEPLEVTVRSWFDPHPHLQTLQMQQLAEGIHHVEVDSVPEAEEEVQEEAQ